MSGVFASFAKQLWSEVKTHGPTVRLARHASSDASLLPLRGSL